MEMSSTEFYVQFMCTVISIFISVCIDYLSIYQSHKCSFNFHYINQPQLESIQQQTMNAACSVYWYVFSKKETYTVLSFNMRMVHRISIFLIFPMISISFVDIHHYLQCIFCTRQGNKKIHVA